MNGVWIFFCMIGAFAVSGLCVTVFNALPAKWLCDYGEQPSPELCGKRLFFWPHGIIMTLILAASFLSLSLQNKNGYFFFIACAIVVILLLIAVSDLKYSIIPDQFILALFAAALVFDGYDLFRAGRLFHFEWFSPLLGATAGAGIMLLLGVFGKLLYKKEALGFGDVKLFGTAGFLAGFPDILLLFFMTIFLAFFHIVYLLIRKKISKNIYLPLGPYICLALLLFLAFHSQISTFAGWYFSLLNL